MNTTVRNQVIEMSTLYKVESAAKRARQIVANHTDLETLINKAYANKPHASNEIESIVDTYNKLEQLDEKNFELFKKGVHSGEQSRANTIKNKYNQHLLIIVLSDYAERVDFKIIG